MAVAKRLAMQRENRKILIVVSDGEPACPSVQHGMLHGELMKTVKQVTDAGIEVLGIGVQTKSVERFYNEETGASHVVVKDIDKLALEVFRAFRDMLQKSQKGRRAA